MKGFLFISLLFIFTQTYAQDYKYRTCLTITIDDIYESRFNSYLNRELRKIEDIEVLDCKNSDYEISIVGIKVESIFAVSLVVTKKIRTDTIRDFILTLENGVEWDESRPKKFLHIQRYDSSTVGRVIDYFVSDAENLKKQMIMTDTDIENLSKRIVTEVDYGVFEEIRKRIESIMREIEN